MNVSKLVAKLRSVVEGHSAPATAPVGAHGKLELHKEFLDHFPTNSKLADEYRAWVQQGWETCLAGQNDRRLVAHRIVMSDPKNQNWLIGCIWPSRDRPPDSRRYFYTQFVILPALRETEWPFLAGLARPIWESLERMYGSLRSVPDAAGWRSLIRSKSLSTAMDVTRAGEAVDAALVSARGIKLQHWMPLVGQAYGSPADFVDELSHRMRRLKRSVDDGPSLWRLESLSDLPSESQLIAWLGWFERNVPRGSGRGNISNSRFVLLIPTESGADVVPHLMTRALRATDFGEMSVLAEKHEAVADDNESSPPAAPLAADQMSLQAEGEVLAAPHENLNEQAGGAVDLAWAAGLGPEQSLAEFADYRIPDG